MVCFIFIFKQRSSGPSPELRAPSHGVCSFRHHVLVSSTVREVPSDDPRSVEYQGPPPSDRGPPPRPVRPQTNRPTGGARAQPGAPAAHKNGALSHGGDLWPARSPIFPLIGARAASRGGRLRRLRFACSAADGPENGRPGRATSREGDGAAPGRPTDTRTRSGRSQVAGAIQMSSSQKGGPPAAAAAAAGCSRSLARVAWRSVER